MPYCAYCGHEISPAATSCPNCGHPVDAPIGRPPPSADAQAGELAGFWIRFVGLLIDGVLVFVVTLPFGADVYVGRHGFRFFTNRLFTPAMFVYAWLMIGLMKGQTVGMMAAGLRALRPNGAPVDLGRAAARAGMAIISSLALFLGFLWAAWDPEKRTWHDMVADTRVFRTRTPIRQI